MTRDRLEAALARFIDRAMTGDDDGAALAFADCQALGDLPATRLEATTWTATECRAVANLSDSDTLTTRQHEQQLARARREHRT